jgi:hypothetical protein
MTSPRGLHCAGLKKFLKENDPKPSEPNITRKTKGRTDNQ